MPKCGDVHPETGLIFWSNGSGWLTQATFDSYRAKSKVRCARYYANHREKMKAVNKAWAKEHPDRVKELRANNYRKYITTSPIFALKARVRSRLRCIMERKGLKNRPSTLALLGCDFQSLKSHIEKQFTNGMTWENHGFYGWHIDHKVPLCTAKTTEEMFALCHFSNLQPLWAIDNLTKSRKVAA